MNASVFKRGIESFLCAAHATLRKLQLLNTLLIVAGGAHRDSPAVAGRTDDVGVGHEHVVEEDLGEALVAVEPLDRTDGHPRLSQRHQQQRQSSMSL